MIKKCIFLIITSTLLFTLTACEGSEFAAPEGRNGGLKPKTEIILDEHVYQLFDATMTWGGAQSYCKSIQGHLVTITSEKEQEAVQSLVREGRKNGYWIGLSVSNEPEWVTGELFRYSNWAGGEPQKKTNSTAFAQVWNEDGFGWVTEFPVYENEEEEMLPDNIGFICEWDTLEEPEETE